MINNVMLNNMINKMIDIHKELEDAAILEGGPDISLKFFLLKHQRHTNMCIKAMGDMNE